MEENHEQRNTERNLRFYDELYRNFDTRGIRDIVADIDGFIDVATTTHNSWVGLYYDQFHKDFKGKKILELGCGDCTNLAVMAALGAEVYGNDLSAESGVIVDKINSEFTFNYPIQFIYGDFLKSDFPNNFFDIIVGKAFAHHLTHEQEEAFAQKCARILKPNGVLRYCEPAVNNKFLDELRWMIPVQGRPSILQKEKFAIWAENDPHPERDNSGNRYTYVGKMFFDEVQVIPYGWIERFNRILPRGEFNRKFSRWAFRAEKYLPHFVNYTLARSQVITYKKPKHI